MIITNFDQVWEETDKIPGSFTKENGYHLFEQALGVPIYGSVIEIGVDQGRSASLLLTAAKIKGFYVSLVDSWESVLIDNYERVKALRSRFPKVRCSIFHAKSADIVNQLPGPYDLIHIDANHTAESADEDCRLWLGKVKHKGIACFHDYDMDGVRKAVDKYTANWEKIGDFDNLAIRRKHDS